MAAPQNPYLTLLDATTPFDAVKVQLLDQALHNFYNGGQQDRQQAQAILEELQKHPQAWRLVQTILVNTNEENTQYFALTILQVAVETRWNTIPKQDRDGIPKYLTDLSVTAACNPRLAQHFRTKINLVLVEVARRTWPDEWPNFISEFCALGRSDQRVCGNTLKIFSIFSEEILDFGGKKMTSKKCLRLRQRLGEEFRSIIDLCLFVFRQHIADPTSVNASLIKTTLECLIRFIRWNSLEYLFHVEIPEMLINAFWENLDFRIPTIKCFVEIFKAPLPPADAQPAIPGAVSIHERMARLWFSFLEACHRLPPQAFEYETKVPHAMKGFWSACFLQLLQAVTAFCQEHFQTICQQPSPAVVASVYSPLNRFPNEVAIETLTLVCKLTRLPGEETFKIAIEFWHRFAEQLTAYVNHTKKVQEAAGNGSSFESICDSDRVMSLYQPILNNVRAALVDRMARPPEVCIVFDEESGTVDRDYIPDTDEIATYQLMRQTLVLLAHLGQSETESLILGILKNMTETAERDRAQQNWNPSQLNRLCWAAGAVSGTLPVQREKKFFVSMLRLLLWLCEVQSGKDNKALVASMIMYLNGQFTRVLCLNETFLRIIVVKNYEFMLDRFPGVQDMAANTLYKVCVGCSSILGVMVVKDDPTGPSEGYRMIQWMLEKLPEHLRALQTSKQVLLIYHAMAAVISGAPAEERESLVAALCARQNETWSNALSLLQEARRNGDVGLLSVELKVVRAITEVLMVHEKVADAVGVYYGSQLLQLLPSALDLYRLYEEILQGLVASNMGKQLSHAVPMELRHTRRAFLKLLETFINRARDSRAIIVESVVPPVLSTIFAAYGRSPVELKDAEVLNLGSSFVRDTFRNDILPHFKSMFDCLFEPTLSLLSKSYDSYHDLRGAFFTFLHMVIVHCFPSVAQIEPRLFASLVNALIFAIQDEKPDIANLGLKGLLVLLKRVREQFPPESRAFRDFVSNFHETLLQEVLGVATDTLHTSGFPGQCLILQELACWAEAGLVPNVESLMTDVGRNMAMAFPNLNQKQIEIFLIKVFTSPSRQRRAEYQQHIQDLIVQLRELAGSDDLFEAERMETIEAAKRQAALRSVPGYILEIEKADEEVDEFGIQ